MQLYASEYSRDRAHPKSASLTGVKSLLSRVGEVLKEIRSCEIKEGRPTKKRSRLELFGVGYRKKKKKKPSGTTFSIHINWTRPGPRKIGAVSMWEYT